MEFDPLNSAGNGKVNNPSSFNNSNISWGYSAVASISLARGAIFSTATRRIKSRISRCSSLKSKFTIPSALPTDRLAGFERVDFAVAEAPGQQPIPRGGADNWRGGLHG